MSSIPTRSGVARPSLLMRVADGVWSLPPLLTLGLLTVLACWSIRVAALVLLAAMALGLLTLAAGPAGRFRHDWGRSRLIRPDEDWPDRHPGRIVAVHPDRHRPGRELTLDDYGLVRSGPAGAWWTHLLDRPIDVVGFGLDVTRACARGWNLALLAFEVAAGWRAHAVGVSWLILGVTFVGPLAVGVTGLVVLARRDRRREQVRANRAAPPTPVTERELAEPPSPDVDPDPDPHDADRHDADRLDEGRAA